MKSFIIIYLFIFCGKYQMLFFFVDKLSDAFPWWNLFSWYGNIWHKWRVETLHLWKVKLNVCVLISCAWYLQLQSFQIEDIKQDYDTGKDGISMVTFKVDFDRAEKLEEAVKANCSRDLVFYKHWETWSCLICGCGHCEHYWTCHQGSTFRSWYVQPSFSCLAPMMCKICQQICR